MTRPADRTPRAHRVERRFATYTVEIAIQPATLQLRALHAADAQTYGSSMRT